MTVGYADRGAGRRHVHASTSAATDPQGDLIRYNLMFSDKHITGNRGFDQRARSPRPATASSRCARRSSSGVWKVYVYAFDGHGNVGIEQRSFRVVPPTVPGTNIALNRPVTASSYQPTGTNGPQLPVLRRRRQLRHPLGQRVGRHRSGSRSTWARCSRSTTSCSAWEAAYARSYQIQTSNDGANWTTVYSTTAGNGGFDDLIPVTGVGPVRAGERHGAGDRVRLLAVGVRRLSLTPLTSGALRQITSRRALSHPCAINAAMRLREVSRERETSAAQRLPTLEDVAQVAGVSRATVSRVINGIRNVDPELHEVVWQRRQRRPATCPTGPPARSSPAAPARSRWSSPTRRATTDDPFMSRFFTDPFFGRVVGGVMSVLRPVGVQLALQLVGSHEARATARRRPAPGPGRRRRSCSRCIPATRCPGCSPRPGCRRS